jgi:uncharacterized protein (TIGR03435 family)
VRAMPHRERSLCWLLASASRHPNCSASDMLATLVQRSRRRIRLLLVSGSLVVTGLAQPQTTTPTPKFEVAAIKLSKDCGGSRGRLESSPGRLTINCQSLSSLIMTAYFVFTNGHLNPDFPQPSIEGGPSWIDSDLYTIIAKPEGTPRQEVMEGPMLQALLEDRFKLRAHFEAKGEVPAYLLTVAKGGPKLQRFKEGSCTPIESNEFLPPPLAPGEKRCPGSVLAGAEPNINVLDVRGVTLDQFAGVLRYPLWGSVIDKTGITGRFDFHLEFAIDETSPRFVPDGASGPSVFTAIQQQLGLKLESSKEPQRVLVIDSVERPSEN